MFKDIIGNDLVNTGRQCEMDLGRALPVFCLPFVHTVIECTPVERIYEPIPFFFNIIIGQPLGAPIFIFVMGACIHYSHKNEPKTLMKRGLLLFIAGFLLNALRFLIPYLIGYAVTGEADKFITPLPYRVFGNDILQFAGLFFILMGFFLYKRVPDLWIIIIAAAMTIPGTLLRHTDLNNPVLNIALSHFIGTQDAAGLVMSDFPVLNWFFVPASGYLFGKMLIRLKEKKKFYGVITPVLLIPTVAFFVLEYIFEFGQMDSGATLVESENCYYHLMFYDALALTVFAAGILGLYYFLINIFPRPLQRFVVSLSRNITHVYVIHWFLVVMLTNVLIYSIRGTQELPIGWTLLLSLGILMITYPLSLLWEHISNNRKRKVTQ